MYYSTPRQPYPNELYHHGVLGQKWGIRRYQPYPPDYKGDGKEIGEARHKNGPEYKTKREIKKYVRSINRTLKKGDREIEDASVARVFAIDKYNKARKRARKAYDKLQKNKTTRNMIKFTKAQGVARDANRRREFWDKEFTRMTSEQMKRSDDARKAYSGVKRAKYDYRTKAVVVPNEKGEWAVRTVDSANEAFQNWNDRFAWRFNPYVPQFNTGPWGMLAKNKIYTSKVERDAGFDSKAGRRQSKQFIKEIREREKARKNYLR